MDLLEEYATSNIGKMAKRYGIRWHTMRQRIIDAGGTIKTCGQQPGAKDPARYARIVEARRKGAKIVVIVRRERCSSATVWKALRAAGMIGGGS